MLSWSDFIKKVEEAAERQGILLSNVDIDWLDFSGYDDITVVFEKVGFRYVVRVI